MTEISENKKEYSKSKTALVSIASNSFLIILKLIAGILTGSIAIISEAVHSGLDLLAAFLAYGSIKIAGRPADHDHPFGHGKAENISALFQALLILVAGALIIHQAIISLLNPKPLPSLGFGIIVMFISTVVNIFVSRHLFKVGRKTDSAALIADAWHLKTDVYTSLGVVFGLTIITGAKFLKLNVNLDFIDPLCALLVALLIIKAGLTLTLEALSHLMDAKLSDNEIKIIAKHILEYHHNCLGYKDLKTRKAGSMRFIEYDLLVPGHVTVQEAHEIGREINLKICSDIKNCYITYHLEPSPEDRCHLRDINKKPNML